MNLPTVIATTGVAWAAFTTLRSMGQRRQIVLTIAGLIAAWVVFASTIYRVVSSLKIIDF